MKTKKPSFCLFVMLAFLSTIWLHLSCRSENQSASNRALPEMEFLVDSTLLGMVFEDSSLHIQFQPPLSWQPLAAGNMALAKAMADSLSPYPLTLKAVFFDSLTSSMMLVSDLGEADQKTLDKVLEAPETVFNSTKNWEQVQAATFRFNKLTADQVLLQNQALVVFKLLFFKDLEEKFQIDYLIPKQVYAEKVRHIESSIGSIRRLEE